MKKVELTESDCIFVHHVLRMYASKTEGLDDEDKIKALKGLIAADGLEKYLGIKSSSLIIPIIINDNKKVLEIQEILKENNFLIGAIRQPTVKEAIIRLIAKIDISDDDLINVCNLLKKYKID